MIQITFSKKLEMLVDNAVTECTTKDNPDIISALKPKNN